MAGWVPAVCGRAEQPIQSGSARITKAAAIDRGNGIDGLRCASRFTPDGFCQPTDSSLPRFRSLIADAR